MQRRGHLPAQLAQSFPHRGAESIGFELLQQLDWQAPDWVVLPAGNLGNTSAIGKAFRQAYQLSLISHMPRIASIQAAGANPFYRSFMQKFAQREQVQAHTVATPLRLVIPSATPVLFASSRRATASSRK